jgi:hypothetical protein
MPIDESENYDRDPVPDADYSIMWEHIRPLVHQAGFELADIRGTDQGREKQRARSQLFQLRAQVCYVLCEELGYSQPTVADFLHCGWQTVKYRCRLIRQRAAQQPE